MSFLPRGLKLACVTLTVVLLVSPAVHAGVRTGNDAYPFLLRAWLYGCTEQAPPTMRPASLQDLLLRLEDCDRHRDRLPAAEQAELDELLSELAVLCDADSLTPDSTRWRRMIPEGWPIYSRGAHLYGIRRDDFRLSVDPVIGWQGIYDESYSHEPLLRSDVGAEVQLTFGAHWTSGIRFVDTAEYNENKNRGTYSPDAGYVGAVSPAGASASFDETLAFLEYNSEYVDLGVGRDRMAYGPDPDHGLLLSGNAPSYLYLQLRARLKPWLEFNFFHARLDPAPVPDEIHYVSPSGRQRLVVNQKWLASHRVEWTPFSWLEIGATENVIYAERDAELGYLIPLNLYWSENHHQDRDDNITWGGDVRAKVTRGVSAYVEGLLDETSLGGILSDKLHNRTALLAGADLIEPLGLHESLLQLQFTALRPYVYSHWFAVSVYTHDGTSLGSPIPPNSEAVSVRLEKRFRGTWEMSVLGQRLRHGETIPGQDPVGGSVFELVPAGNRNKRYPMLVGEKVTTWRGETRIQWEPLENLSLGARLGATRVGRETFFLFLAGFGYNL